MVKKDKKTNVKKYYIRKKKYKRLKQSDYQLEYYKRKTRKHTRKGLKKKKRIIKVVTYVEHKYSNYHSIIYDKIVMEKKEDIEKTLMRYVLISDDAGWVLLEINHSQINKDLSKQQMEDAEGWISGVEPPFYEMALINLQSMRFDNMKWTGIIEEMRKIIKNMVGNRLDNIRRYAEVSGINYHTIYSYFYHDIHPKTDKIEKIVKANNILLKKIEKPKEKKEKKKQKKGRRKKKGGRK